MLPQEKSLAASKLDGYYYKVKSKWAKWLSHRTALFTKKDWLLVLGVFITTMGGYCGYLIFKGFSGASSLFTVFTMEQPVIAKEGSTITNAKPKEPEIKDIIEFHRYMDSLARDPTGKKLYDSIIEIRPGLMDSIRKIEKVHQH